MGGQGLLTLRCYTEQEPSFPEQREISKGSFRWVWGLRDNEDHTLVARLRPLTPPILREGSLTLSLGCPMTMLKLWVLILVIGQKCQRSAGAKEPGKESHLRLRSWR